jgi:hypothetical protein
MNPMQPAAGHTIPYSSRAEAKRRELPKGDHAVLRGGDRSDQQVQLTPRPAIVELRRYECRFSTIAAHGAMVARKRRVWRAVCA